MAQVPKIHVYWHGIIGIPGKGPSIIINYDPKSTINDVIMQLKFAGFKPNGIFKFKPGNLNNYDRSDPYFSPNTTLSEFMQHFGGLKQFNQMVWV